MERMSRSGSTIPLLHPDALVRSSALRPDVSLSSRLLALGKFALPFVVLVVVWELSALALGLSSYLYPRPKLVFDTFGILIAHGVLFAYAETSLWRWLVGVVGGIGLAVPVAVALSFSRPIARMFFPLINFFTAIVELAWIPLFVLWFGYGFKVIVLSIAYVAFFPVIASTMTGITQISPAAIHSARVLGANRRQLAVHVFVPGALPGIVTGIRTGAGYGFRSLIGAEMIAAHSGLGYMILESRANQLTQRTIAGMISIGIIWLLIDRLYLRSLEQATIERWGMTRRARR